MRIIGDDKARLLSKVQHIDDHWLWTGAITSGGYGNMWHQGKYRPAHRVSYELLIGPIPEGLELDHLCRVRNCVNPEHLEPVSRRENLVRGQTIVADQLQRVACPKGHAYDASNTYVHAGQRFCRTCHAANERQRRKVSKW